MYGVTFQQAIRCCFFVFQTLRTIIWVLAFCENKCRKMMMIIKLQLLCYVEKNIRIMMIYPFYSSTQSYGEKKWEKTNQKVFIRKI